MKKSSQITPHDLRSRESSGVIGRALIGPLKAARARVF